MWNDMDALWTEAEAAIGFRGPVRRCQYMYAWRNLGGRFEIAPGLRRDRTIFWSAECESASVRRWQKVTSKCNRRVSTKITAWRFDVRESALSIGVKNTVDMSPALQQRDITEA